MFLGVNEYEEIVYYSKEKFEEMLNWMFSIALLEKMKVEVSQPILIQSINELSGKCDKLKLAAVESGYKLEKLSKLCAEKMVTVDLAAADINKEIGKLNSCTHRNSFYENHLIDRD